MASDIWTKIKNTVGKIAPVLGNAIVPGVGGVAGTLLAGVLGVSNDPEVIDAALGNIKPEQVVELKKVEMQHKERLLELGTENDKAHLADIQSARSREIELTKATGKRDLNLYILAWVVVLGFFILCGLLMKITLPEGQNPVIFMLFGALATGFGQVLQYFFGSSKGSADKTALMAKK